MYQDKIAIIADSLTNKGGVERIILEQAKQFDADIYVARYDKSTFSEFKELKIIPISPFVGTKYGFLGKFYTLYSWLKFSKLKLK